ncbi:hypothetical protein KR054_008004, partial [Drosophila jambulina]
RKMNALKKSPVLNRQCLRNKIEELSPLVLQQLNLGLFNKDTLFRATWNYYASGCQERLTSIRRRIEQNAKIVAPSTGPRTQIHRNLSQILPPGVDLEDHIYHELVCCFRSSDEGPSKAKKARKDLSSPEQWILWKREELEVQHMLMQSKDPYRAEELTRKLQKLRKLTNRDPLGMQPNEAEVPVVSSPKKSKRRPFKEPSKQQAVFPKPGPYVNKSAMAAKESSSIDMESTESTSSDRKSEKISKSFDKDAPRLRFKIESLSEDLEKYTNEKQKKLKSARTRLRKSKRKNPDPPIDAWFFLPPKAQEKSIESMSYESLLKQKSSEIIENPKILSFTRMYPENEVLRRKNKQQNRAHPFFLSHKSQGKKSKSSKWFLKHKSAKVNKKQNKFSKMPQESQFNEDKFAKEINQYDPADPFFFLPGKVKKKLKEASSSKSTLKAKSSKLSQTSEIIENKLSSDQEEFPVVPGDNQDTKRKSKFQFEMKHMEYFKPYGQFKIKGREENLVSQVQMFPEIYWETRKSTVKPVEELEPPEVRIPFMDSHFIMQKQGETISMSNTKTAPSSLGSDENLRVSQPMIISNIIRECMKTYEPDICLRNTFANFMKHNMLDYPEIPETIKKVEKVKKMKRKKKKEFSRKIPKLPSKREMIPCSLCNLVRRRQSELRPYMKKMQEQRQRMELKAYYIQKMLKDRRCQEQDPQQVLAKCYQTLKLCQKLVELRQLQRS